mmetsp:Transcript_51081/g.164992  ORF Transcript_51081/g.164992 Transcript_51081/m.164992 type:complete len:262 (+) Transcript_51081:312-1097(+)
MLSGHRNLRSSLASVCSACAPRRRRFWAGGDPHAAERTEALLLPALLTDAEIEAPLPSAPFPLGTLLEPSRTLPARRCSLTRRPLAAAAPRGTARWARSCGRCLTTCASRAATWRSTCTAAASYAPRCRACTPSCCGRCALSQATGATPPRRCACAASSCTRTRAAAGCSRRRTATTAPSSPSRSSSPRPAASTPAASLSRTRRGRRCCTPRRAAATRCCSTRSGCTTCAPSRGACAAPSSSSCGRRRRMGATGSSEHSGR